MDSVRQRKAVEAVQKILGVTPAPGKPEQAPVMQERVQAEVDTRRFRNVTSDGEKIPVTEGEVDVRRFRNVERGEGV